MPQDKAHKLINPLEMILHVSKREQRQPLLWGHLRRCTLMEAASFLCLLPQTPGLKTAGNSVNYQCIITNPSFLLKGLYSSSSPSVLTHRVSSDCHSICAVGGVDLTIPCGNRVKSRYGKAGKPGSNLV